jgi:hypothetical protein
MNGVPIDSVGGSAQEPVNLEDTEEHDAPPSPNRHVPPFAGDSSHSSNEVSSLQERDSIEQRKWWADYVYKGTIRISW